MPIVKCKDYIEVYEHKARSRDPHELSGRTGRHDLTTFVCQNIVLKLSLEPDDVLVDIGCGDGTLLELAANGMLQGIGILPTDAEIQRVRQILGASKTVQIRKGLAQSTGLPSDSASKLVCNGVLHLLNEAQVDDALKEFARVSRAHGLIFIGEMPFLDEFEGKTYGSSISAWLWWVWRNQGLAAFLRRLRETLAAAFSREPFVVTPKSHFIATPDEFVARAGKSGLILKAHFPHREISPAGETYDSRSRRDYLFEKAPG